MSSKNKPQAKKTAVLLKNLTPKKNPTGGAASLQVAASQGCLKVDGMTL